jgi:hypothetical protein
MASAISCCTCRRSGPLRGVSGCHAAFAGQFVEVVEQIGTFVELLAAGQCQHRHLEQRIERPHGVHVPKHRQRKVLEGNRVAFMVTATRRTKGES